MMPFVYIPSFKYINWFVSCGKYRYKRNGNNKWHSTHWDTLIDIFFIPNTTQSDETHYIQRSIGLVWATFGKLRGYLKTIYPSV